MIRKFTIIFLAAILGGLGVTGASLLSDSESAVVDDKMKFCTEFVPNMEGASYFGKWKAQNSGEYTKWQVFRRDICSGGDPLPPSVGTLFGKALINAGEMALPEASPPPTTTTITTTTTEPPSPQCSDGVNNDSAEDSLIDYPSDPGCISSSDDTESPNPVSGVSPPSNIANDCSVDVTSSLLSWMATVPNGSVISFGNGCYRIESTLEMTARSNLTFDGGTFRSINAPTDQRAIWRLNNSQNLHFQNMLIDGSFIQNEANPAHNSALQHAHAIDLRGTSVEVGPNVTMVDLAGDGVYFGLYDEAVKIRSSGSMHDSTVRRVSRNAASVVAGDNITIERNVSSGIGFVAYDVEPNATTGFGATSVIIRNNTIGTFYLYAFGIFGHTPISGVQVLNNTIDDAGSAIVGMGIIGAIRPQNTTISGNISSVSQSGQSIDARNSDNLTVTNNNLPTSGVLLRCSSVANLTFSGNTPDTKSGCP